MNLTIAANPVVAKLINADAQARAFVTDLLSYQVDGAEHRTSVINGNWDGRSSFFSAHRHTFPAGFLHLVNSELTKKGYRPQIARKPLPAPLGERDPIVDKFGNNDPRYDYQMKVVDALLKHGRGIAQVATGGGKSKIAKLVVARIRRPTLFLTTRGVLMHQMRDQFVEIGYNVGVLGDGEWSPVKGVNVGMVQTFTARLAEPDLQAEIHALIDLNAKRESHKQITVKEIHALAQKRFDAKTRLRAETIAILSMFELVIGEEAHEAGGNSYYVILQHCKNAAYRLALTATPFMRQDAEDNMRLMAAFGPVLLKVSEKTLIDRGILAKPYFRFVDCKPHIRLHKTSPWQRARQLGYVENANMHAEIIVDALKARDYGLPVMTLVTQIPHGKILRDEMRAAGLKAVFIRGDHDNAGRRKALRALAAGVIDVLIGTTILDVGVDVPAVGLVQLAGGGKAEVALRQRIGRGLRAKKAPMPNAAFICDYSCNMNQTLRDHARTRRAIVEQTPGFAENVIPDGKDLPWSMFERKAA